MLVAVGWVSTLQIIYFMDPKRRMILGAILLSLSVLLLCLLSSFVSFKAAQTLSSSNAKSPGNEFFGLHTSSPHPVSSTPTPDDSTTSAPPVLATTTSVTGPHLVMLAVNQDTLTSLLATQLGAQQNTLTNLKIIPKPGNEVTMNMNLNISANGIHRVMPIELDCIVGLDQQQNIQMHVLALKRDGQDAGSAAAARMQTALNQLLLSLLMPSLHNQLKGMKIVSIQTSSALCCGVKTEMLVLVIQLQ
jgi:hypothetical protein